MQNLDELILRIAPDRFHFLKFILEGYDNMAILSSLNSKVGVVVIRYPASLAKDIFALLASIGKKIS
ncbi:MAG: DUF4911 domain-containing protein [Desulfobulbia bacterium]